MSYNLILDDILSWATTYTGPKFHALLSDPPYHLTTITKRFGKIGSAPAQHGKDGAFSRASRGFMGQQWDGGDLAFNPETWAALGEHLYPGAFGMAFASSRGWHRLACAIEDAGFIIHPSIFGWCQLSGFPKATRIDTQVDKLKRREYIQAAIELGLEIPGNSLHDWTKAEHTPGDKWWDRFKAVLSQEQWLEIERKVVGQSLGTHQVGIPLPGQYNGQRQYLDVTAPATPLAQTWEGHRYGLQALKPALEPIIVFQKPYEGRPIDCITQTGAGALDIEAGRIPGPGWKWGTQTDIRGGGYGSNRPTEGDVYAEGIESDPAGRWPANLILDEEAARLLDEQSGILTSGTRLARTNEDSQSVARGKFNQWNSTYYGGDAGGASRMFFHAHWSYEVLEQLNQAQPLRYEPKVSTAEREAGLDELPTRTRHRVNAGGLENEPRFAPVQLKNHHPTLKPISLTKYLASLLLPPAEYGPRRLMVPFAGSGSEMAGGILAGWEEITGIEKSADYAQINRARLAWWSQWAEWGQCEVEKILKAAAVQRETEGQPAQMSLF